MSIAIYFDTPYTPFYIESPELDAKLRSTERLDSLWIIKVSIFRWRIPCLYVN